MSIVSEQELLAWVESMRGTCKARKGSFVCSMFEDDSEVRIVTKAGSKIDAIWDAKAKLDQPGERERIAAFYWRRLNQIKGFLIALDPHAGEKFGDVVAPELAMRREALAKREEAARLMAEAAAIERADATETEIIDPVGDSETVAEVASGGQ